MVSVTLSAQSSVLLSLRCKSPELTVFVHRVTDPVDPRVVTHCVVRRVNQDDLVVLVGRILVEPVGVDDSEAAQFPSSTLLSNGTLAPLELELGDSLVCGLTIHNSLWHWPLASTTSHTDTVHHKALTYIHITTSQVTSLLSLNKKTVLRTRTRAKF